MRPCRARPEQGSPETTDHAIHKPANSLWRQLFWFVVFTSLLFSFGLFFYSSYNSSSLVNNTGNQIAHSLADQATIDHHHDDDDQAPPIDKLLAEDGMLQDSRKGKEKDSVSVTEEVKKPKSDNKTPGNHSVVDQDSGGVSEESKIDADKLPDGTLMNPEFKKVSVQDVGDRGNVREESKIDAGETLEDKLPVGDENKKQGVVQDSGSIRENGEELDKNKMVPDKLPVNGKNQKQGYVLDAGNIKGNAEKVDKLVPVKNVADKLPVDRKSAPSIDTGEAARGKQRKVGSNDVPSKVSENKLNPTQQLPKEGAGVVNGGQDRVNTKQPTTLEYSDSCRGRYIYIHKLPGRFNEDMISNCYSLSKWADMCQYIANFGLGPKLDNARKEFSHGGWFATNQFTLEVIFHHRMKRYKCLTKDSSKASAIYIPYYAGLDVSRYLWYDKELKDSAAIDLARWLRDQPEWKRMWGRDHFFVAGRITWDFRREGDNLRNWGNKLMFLPEAKNMTILTIESSPWHSNDFAIPYPTYFHPKSDYQIRQWQRKVRKMRRKYLFCFAGAPRPNLRNSIRGEIISQCQAARGKCRLLECLKGNKCYQPVYVINMFESSIFCLQPSGDSFTRRSTFDAILAGCIPVFFHPASAYVQYIWHLTKDYHKYSVWISGKDVKEGKVNIEAVLSGIPIEKVVAMREQLIRLIPKITYADPGSRLETNEDAFDIAVNGVLDRVERIRREMGEGKNTSFSFDEEKAWKFYTFGILGEHEWDGLFDRSRSNSLMN